MNITNESKGFDTPVLCPTCGATMEEEVLPNCYWCGDCMTYVDTTETLGI